MEGYGVSFVGRMPFLTQHSSVHWRCTSYNKCIVDIFCVEGVYVEMVLMDLGASRRSTASTETVGRGSSHWASVKTATRAWSWWRPRTTDLYSTRDHWRNSWKVTRRTSWYWRWRTDIHCCVWTSAAERPNWRSTVATDTETWDRTSSATDDGIVSIFSLPARFVLIPVKFLQTLSVVQWFCYHRRLPSSVFDLLSYLQHLVVL